VSVTPAPAQCAGAARISHNARSVENLIRVTLCLCGGVNQIWAFASSLATSALWKVNSLLQILSRYPTPVAIRRVSWKKLSGLCYDGRHNVGEDLASALVGAERFATCGLSDAARISLRSCCCFASRRGLPGRMLRSRPRARRVPKVGGKHQGLCGHYEMPMDRVVRIVVSVMTVVVHVVIGATMVAVLRCSWT